MIPIYRDFKDNSTSSTSDFLLGLKNSKIVRRMMILQFKHSQHLRSIKDISSDHFHSKSTYYNYGKSNILQNITKNALINM